MPIRKLQFTPSQFYHIYNRGNARQNIFVNDKDRYRFLQAMYLSNNSSSFLSIEELERNKSGYTLEEIKKIIENNDVNREPLVKICADCLMPNHFHFLLQETQESGIIKFMQRLGTSYAKYFAIKYDRPGSLFQGRFKAVHINKDEQLRYMLAYINVINPAQLAEPHLKEKGIKNMNKVWEKVNNYKWSTHQEYINKRKSILTDKGLLKILYPDPKTYNDFVRNILKDKEQEFWKKIEKVTID